ncbi:unnamed protein product [Rotaria sp. Silwood1]|nr:unnamed protein product [Rotaria sp. Silwood1]
MKLLVIILSFILLSHIYGLNTDESTGINVLETLKAKNLSCDLHVFVNSTGNSQKEYEVFINDLTQYCSNSESTKSYRVLCHMILIELEIGCSSLNKTQPLPIKYITSYTPDKICSINKILYINRWIWDKLKTNEKNQIGTTSIKLCSTITSFNETLRLANFFYKTASRIREIDTYNIQSLSHQTLTNSSANKVRLVKKKSFKKTNNTSGKKVELENQLLVKNINEDSLLSKHNFEDKITKNKTQLVLDLKQEQFQFDINETQNIEMGIPLGRNEELPARVQVNERPKPKALDIEVVFQSNDGEKRNWIEGRDGKHKEENEPHFHSLQYNRTKSQENRFVVPSAAKRKPKLKPRLSLYRDDDGDWLDKVITGFLVFILFMIIIYLILNHKNKILGLIIEGCRRQRVIHGRRFGVSSSTTRLTRSTHSI